MTVGDLYYLINERMYSVIYENHWTGQRYNTVSKETKVEMILPVDEKTIMLSVTL